MKPRGKTAQRELTIAICLFGLLAVAAFLFGLTEVTDGDSLWHLASGRVILQQGPLHEDPFSFRTAGREWVDAQWLFQLGIYLVYRLAGFPGLSILTACLVASTWLLLCYLGWDQRSGPLTWALVLLALWGASDRLNLRPEVVSLLLVAVYLHLLERDRLKSTRWVFALIACQMVWANIEGIWPIGLAIIAAYWLEALASRNLSTLPLDKPTSANPGRLAIVLFLCIAASLATPYHYHGFLFPFTLLSEITSSNFLKNTIKEFRPPLAQGDVVFLRLPFLVLIAISALSYGLNRQKLRLAHLLLWSAFLYLAWSAQRNVGLFSIAAASFASLHFSRYFATQPPGTYVKRLKTVRSVSLATGLTLVVFYFIALPSNRFYRWDRTFRVFGVGFPANYDLATPAEFLKKIDWKGKVYTDIISAGYLIWVGSPDWQVYVDGRLELYGQELIRDAIESGRDYSLFVKEDRRWDFDAAIFARARSQHPGTLELVNQLHENPRWALVYFDDSVAFYLKDTHRQHGLVTQFKVEVK